MTRDSIFEQMAEPASRVIEGCKRNGLVAQRYAVADKYLYVTFASTGRRSYVIENGYSCDSGDTIDGRIVNILYVQNGTIGDFVEITPVASSNTTGVNLPQNSNRRGVGFLAFQESAYLHRLQDL